MKPTRRDHLPFDDMVRQINVEKVLGDHLSHSTAIEVLGIISTRLDEEKEITHHNPTPQRVCRNFPQGTPVDSKDGKYRQNDHE